jgi:RNA polymerase sporulation-specific sigma factor
VVPGRFASIVDSLKSVLAVSDIASVVGVRERQVHHWAVGTHRPQGEAKQRLLELHYVVELLKATMPADAVDAWLSSPHPALDGQSPMRLLRRGEYDSVGRAAQEVLRETEAVRQLDDKRLVDSARRGSVNALEWLIRKYYVDIRRRAEAAALVGLDPEVVSDKGISILYVCIQRHDHDELRDCLVRELDTALGELTGTDAAQLLRCSTGYARWLDDQFALLAEHDTDAGDRTKRRADLLVTTDDGHHVVVEVKMAPQLSALERQVAELLEERLDYHEVARRLGVTPKAVDNARQRIRRKRSYAHAA